MRHARSSVFATGADFRKTPCWQRDALVALANIWGESYCRAVYCAEFGEGRNIENSDTIEEVLKSARTGCHRCARAGPVD